MKIAINGFGRIGRSFLRALLLSDTYKDVLTVNCINIGPARIDDIAYLFAYDSTMGMFPEQVHIQNNCLCVGKHVIPLVTEPDPTRVPWKQYGIDWVVECSGRFTKRKDAALHLQAGAQQIVISAPSTDADITIIPGVNTAQYDPQKHEVVSLGSCTTNALFPILAGLQKKHCIEYGCMTTVHAYTNSQTLLDVNTSSSDVRRFRAAPQNIIPTSTGAAQLIGKIFPELEGKIQAMALRVPLPNVSLIDLQLVLAKEATPKQINAIFAEFAAGQLQNILAVSHEPLVSSDYLGSPYSVTIDAALTTCIGPMLKLVGWYDNEWGYSCRLRDFLVFVASLSGR